MISGLFVDIALLAATVAFAWAGLQLGGTASTMRTIGIIVAFLLAILLRDPAGDLIHHITGKGIEIARLTAMLAVASATYGAMEKLLSWVKYRLEEDQNDWFEARGLEEKILDPLSTPTAGAVSGGLLGLGWSLMFVALLVLAPSDSFWSRAATHSNTGSLMISREHALRWIVRGFPHYTQTLPKGKIGAKVGPIDDLPFHGDIDPKDLKQDPDDLLRALNRIRAKDEQQTLVWNPELAGVARRHAETLAVSGQLVDQIPGNGDIKAQARAALGNSSDAFDDKVGIVLVWAHSPANAGAAIDADAKAVNTLQEPNWTEVGIGAVDAGWFNGRIYVIALVAAKGDDGDAAAAVGGAPSTDDPPPPQS
jgi:uncharacterized protein YkwD